ncbi:MAG: leucine--tRNA ligase [Fusobacterium sp. JB019]|nr:leucine--tRNA ligase [Fusobacterium sp. JB019]
MKEYNFKEVEEKWQEKWNQNNLFKTENTVENKENYYVLVMLPYPSGKLHVGHARNYTIGDVISRYKRMKGYNVLQPMGWDSFGLPAENAAIQNGAHPAIWTKSNIKNMKRQLKLMGLSYDWDREIASYTPEYYKWNQWIFKKFYEKGLIYKKKSTVNWCPDCQTVLANEQVEDGKCWRHSKTQVIQKELEQWFFKITDYADELLDGHKELKGGWPDKVLAMQKNWIGKSYGTEIVFTVQETGEKLPMFTTRIDTIYGVTYAVVAPEHPIVDKIIENNNALKSKIEAMKNTDIIERTAEGKEKTGVATGWHVINPVNGEKVPLWIADYVLMNYGTGAVMAVPSHDERDFAFAKKYDLPMKIVINPKGQEEIIDINEMTEAFTEVGQLVNSGEFNGINSKKAIGIIADYVEENGWGEKTVKYRLKDWGISRQRYWGTPIPALYCEKCGMVMEKDENLPVKLPEDIEFTGNGNPIETSEEYKNAICPICGGPARRETDTMDTFVDSSWYFLRYCDPKNDAAPFSKEIVDKWFPVSQYIGGVEHAVMHLLYARFFHKALRDINLVSSDEPFKRLLTQGMVLSNSYFSEKENKFMFLDEVDLKGEKAYSKKTGEELLVKMEKMSKSKNNGVDPEEIMSKYGADAVRLFIMFTAPPERELEWNENGLSGASRFLNRVWRIIVENKSYISEEKADYSKASREDKALVRKLHQTIKRITDSIEDNYHFNTAIAGTMELVNEVYSYRANVLGTEKETSESKKIFGETIRDIVIMLSPFTPHFTSELWEEIGAEENLFDITWPEYDEKLTISDEATIAIQVNGKMRGSIIVDLNATKEEIEGKAFEVENVRKHITDKQVVKVIVIPKKIINIVVK